MQANQGNDYAQEQIIYFRMMADLDNTKHIGGMPATQELISLCAIKTNDLVLDVGCGVGVTPVKLVEQLNCRIVGVDLEPKMIFRAKMRARRAEMAAQTAYLPASALQLPFNNNSFDAVIAESVLSFVPDKEQALAEMIRVLKPGCVVAFTEAIWLRAPEPEQIAVLSRAAGLPAGLLQNHEWEALLQAANLTDIVARPYPITAQSEARSQLARIGIGQYLRTLAGSGKVLFNPAYRGLLKDAVGSSPRGYFEIMGYGIYAGRKKKE